MSFSLFEIISKSKCLWYYTINRIPNNFWRTYCKDAKKRIECKGILKYLKKEEKVIFERVR